MSAQFRPILAGQSELRRLVTQIGPGKAALSPATYEEDGLQSPPQSDSQTPLAGTDLSGVPGRRLITHVCCLRQDLAARDPGSDTDSRWFPLFQGGAALDERGNNVVVVTGPHAPAVPCFRAPQSVLPPRRRPLPGAVRHPRRLLGRPALRRARPCPPSQVRPSASGLQR